MIRNLFAVLLLAASPLVGGDPRAQTYSIVAFDPATGELGVAVQSHWFSVVPIVPWAESGAGAVATQSIAEPAYGPPALTPMRAGTSYPDDPLKRKKMAAEAPRGH